MIRSINPSEHQIQAAIVEWANTIKICTFRKFIEGKETIGSYLIKNANEGKRSFSQGKKMKKEGLKKGVSDLFLAIPKEIENLCEMCEDYILYCGLWIEVKSKKGRLSKEQISWLELMKVSRYQACVVYSVGEGLKAIKDYLGMR